ncbi:MAG: hypothetical protein COW84_00105 [Gammaproteobacteria bacterium CG22_combo_CG10-13_8_21_14_all_40_8]|nr:MAG: hypothetical protein COW84_00105 [Gammaproteobacteria bacterium CG22_combo_CG10-13_8_21_14_all_40_8]
MTQESEGKKAFYKAEYRAKNNYLWLRTNGVLTVESLIELITDSVKLGIENNCSRALVDHRYLMTEFDHQILKGLPAYLEKNGLRRKSRVATVLPLDEKSAECVSIVINEAIAMGRTEKTFTDPEQALIWLLQSDED